MALALGSSLLLAAEVALRLAGYGGPGHRPDPFAGFSAAEPLFVHTTGAGGEEILRTRDDRIGAFNPQSFHARKAARTRRLFCLGGSATFGFPYDDAHSFCRLLERALQKAHPEAPVEVINCGGMSYGSRRILNLAREVIRYQPDGLVVYMGHNEYVERRFFAPFLNEPDWKRHLRGALNRLRLYAALRRALQPLAARGHQAPGGLFGVERDDSLRQHRDPQEDRLIKDQFLFVLREIAELARHAGISLFLVNPASNLRGWAPEGSDWSETLARLAQQRRNKAMSAARSLFSRGQWPGALRAVNEALRLDPLPATAHYLRGQILDAMGRFSAARAAYAEARDRDGVPIRMPGFLSDAIRREWREAALEPLDAAATLAAASPGGIVGDEMILDYCHPTAAGNRRIVELLLPAVQKAFWGREGIHPVALDSPGVDRGENDEPDSAFGSAWIGQMMVRQGRWTEARPFYIRALALDPALAMAHEGLGRLLVQGGQVDEGIRELEEAARLDPHSAATWSNLGLAYSRSGRPEAAIKAFQTALRKGQRGEAVIRLNLAEVLIQEGRLAQAKTELDWAVQRSPADGRAWLLRGRWAEARGDRDLAISAYRRALELAPGSTAARTALQRLSAASP